MVMCVNNAYAFFFIFVARINYENMFTTKPPDLRYMEYTVQTELLYNNPTHYISTCRILLTPSK